MPEPAENWSNQDAIPANGTFSPDRAGLSGYHFLDKDRLAGTALVTAVHSGSIDFDKDRLAGMALVTAVHSGSIDFDKDRLAETALVTAVHSGSIDFDKDRLAETALVIAFHSGAAGPTADIPHLALIRREDIQKNAFERRLFHLFALEPLDDGYAHPAEGLLEKALTSTPTSTQDWIRSIVANEEKPASVVAGIVHCLSRLERNVLDLWALDIGEIALAHSEVEVREAGVRVMETVGGPRAIEILRTHQEQVSWMRRYITQVTDNLSA